MGLLYKKRGKSVYFIWPASPKSWKVFYEPVLVKQNFVTKFNITHIFEKILMMHLNASMKNTIWILLVIPMFIPSKSTEGLRSFQVDINARRLGLTKDIDIGICGDAKLASLELTR